MLAPSSIEARVQVAPAPSAGSVEVMAFPWPSSNTHIDDDGHESAFSGFVVFASSICATVQVALAPSAGSMEVTALP